MSTQLIKLQILLRELFQLDQADLDFGIYRIMALRRDEITRFLDQDLLPQVRAAFDQFRPADRAHTTEQLSQAIAQAQALGIDPDQTPKVKELREKLDQAVDVAALEASVYDHLYDFLRRYYKEGDFISQRRYKEGVYAIPYEGEEVKLYWANHDQYYIKSAETLTSYAFKTNDGRRVRFELAAAAAEWDNVKPAAGQERRFLLHEAAPVVEDADGLVVRFEYRPDDQGRKQVELNVLVMQGILAAAPNDWNNALAEPAPTEADPGRTALKKHIATYTARNTFDYFIHKDLGGFLRRELDFYIKNEVLHLDDIDQADMAQVEQSLSVVKVLRQIAHKLIDFLASIEDFQKRLWLKKKFVVETNWCITLDRVPEEFYPEIAANDAQREEWVRLFAIDEIVTDLTRSGFSVPLTDAFLRAHPTMLVDTRYFSDRFTEELLATIGKLDAKSDGLLLHSENFQALGLLQQRYRGQVPCVYIDPPYNTGDSQIIYKNEYLRSSWLTLMENRLTLATSLFADDPVLFIAIDDFEMVNMARLIDSQYSSLRREMIIVNHHPQGGKARTLASTHEYMITCVSGSSSRTLTGRMTKDGAELRPFKRSGTAESNFRYGRPNSFYAILVNPGTKDVIGVEPPPTGSDYPKEHDRRGNVRVYPLGGKGEERVWRRSYESCIPLVQNGKLQCSENLTIYHLIEAEERTSALFSNWVDPRYNAGTFGANLLGDVIGAHNPFSYPKSIHTVGDAIFAADLEDDALCLDYFAGSGTTGHAVINLNREDGGRRMFILIEMGEHFDTVLVPRIKKITFSPQWKAGKPSRSASQEEAERGPHVVKAIRLESYEDSLDNLAFQRTLAQQSLLDAQPAAREDFMLRYLLDLDTRGSASLLDVQRFANPFDYKLKITRNYEQREAVVDLVETFNYLLGLRVDHMAARIHRTADFERDEHGRLVVKDGRTRACQPGEGWTFRTISGRSPAGEKVLVVWRTLTGDAERDNAMLDVTFARMDIRPRDQEFDLIYVNGDNNLENLRRPDETWKVRLIEEDFHRLMWDVQDV